MFTLQKVLPIFFFGLVFGLIVWQVSPPQNLADNPFILLIFLFPLVLFFIFLFNLFFQSYLKSIVLSLGVIILLILQAINFLNIFSLITVLALTIIIFKILIGYPQKKSGFVRKRGFKTSPQVKIPKLSHLEKQ